MLRFFVSGLCLAALLGCATPTDNDAPAAEAAVVNQRTLLVMTANDPAPVIRSVEDIGYVVTRIDRLDALEEVMIHLRIPEGQTIPDAIAQVEALHPEVTAGANHAYRIQSTPRRFEFAHEMIGWPTGGCPARRSVGLIDAGVEPGHPDLGTGRIVQAAFHGSKAPPLTNHGTLMADLLIGEGRLTGGRLFSANVIDPNITDGKTAGVDAILRAIDWLKSENVSLANISLAGPFNKLMNRGLGTAAANGMIIVAAAGNIGPDAPPQYPAAYPYVLAVTAVDRNLSIYRRAVRGDHIDVAAPGVDVMVRSAGQTRIASGTSVAAPYVTAVVATDPRIDSVASVEGLRRHLQGTAQDLGPTGPDDIFGAGLIRFSETCNN